MLEAECSEVVGDRFVQLPSLLQAASQVVVNAGVVRSEASAVRYSAIASSVVVLVQGVSEVGVGPGKVRFLLNQNMQVGYCPVKCFPRHRVHAALHEQARIAGPVASVVGTAPQEVLEDSNRFIPTAAALKGVRKFVPVSGRRARAAV